MRGGLLLFVAAMVGLAPPAQAAPGDHPKLDRVLTQRANGGPGTSRVIVTFDSGWDGASEAKTLGGKLGRRLNLINAQVMELPNGALTKAANHPSVRRIHWDRPTIQMMNRVAVASGARGVQQVLGITGAGVGVAVIDSGISPWHDDLTYAGSSPAVQARGGQRVTAFVDFVNGRATPYDDNGHGTHVSGIIAGNGYDSRGVRAGMAPDAHIVSLKVLDASGCGVISDVISALEYVVNARYVFNIRVANLSVGAGVYESYTTDPLTLAAKRATDAGIVVVTAAGNLGKNRDGQLQYGGIVSPGNAPWVLTVGASSHEGTIGLADDTVAPYSSRGPAAIDFTAKPDLVAHGTGVVSLSDPSSTFYSTRSEFLLKGSVDPGYKPYLSLSGTSMAAPVVAGTIALMMEANPDLTPNLVKAVLQYTAQQYSGYDALTQGAGFLNASGAVDLARYFKTAQAGARYPDQRMWSQKIIWGSHRLSGGAISPSGNAWSITTLWGVAKTKDGDNIVWGTRCDQDGDEDCDNIVWGPSEEGDSIVWGTVSDDGDSIVWGTSEDGDSIVWGTARDDGDNIVWGTDCGGEDCDSIVWGTVSDDGDSIVWGTAGDGDSIVWGTAEDGDSIVWGTDFEAFVWGNSCVDDVVFDDAEAPPAEFVTLSWSTAEGL